MKKLPELYKNNNIKPIDNNKKVYYMKNEDMSKQAYFSRRRVR